MRCYHRLDRLPEAVSAYRRLKQTLSVTLSLPPSAGTGGSTRPCGWAELVWTGSSLAPPAVESPAFIVFAADARR